MSGTHGTAAARPRQNKFLPLYHQVEQLVRQRIVKQQYGPAPDPFRKEPPRAQVSGSPCARRVQELVRGMKLKKVKGKENVVANPAPPAEADQ